MSIQRSASHAVIKLVNLVRDRILRCLLGYAVDFSIDLSATSIVRFPKMLLVKFNNAVYIGFLRLVVQSA